MKMNRAENTRVAAEIARNYGSLVDWKRLKLQGLTAKGQEMALIHPTPELVESPALHLSLRSHLAVRMLRIPVENDENKIDEMVLALLDLTLHDDNRAWKGHDWGAMDRLHAKGYISNPATSAKSVVLTDEGISRSEELFNKYFGTPPLV